MPYHVPGEHNGEVFAETAHGSSPKDAAAHVFFTGVANGQPDIIRVRVYACAKGDTVLDGTAKDDTAGFVRDLKGRVHAYCGRITRHANGAISMGDDR